MDYLKYIVDELHSVVFATVDGGKKFYERLKADGNIAFTAVKGRDTLSSVAATS